MDQLSCVQIVQGLSNLVYDITLVLLAQQSLPNQSVQVDVHELEKDINVLFRVRSDHPSNLYYVRVLAVLFLVMCANILCAPHNCLRRYIVTS